MNDYMSQYDSFKKKIVFNFKVGSGGIGDLLKFFLYALQICIKHGYRLHYLVNGATIERYLKLKYPVMYIHSLTDYVSCTSIQMMHDAPPELYAVITPFIFYDVFQYDQIYMQGSNVFEFSPEVIRNSILPESITNYSSIHVRLGDKYLETEKTFVVCPDDERIVDESLLIGFIQSHLSTPLLFMCDNHTYKIKIKSAYDNIIITSGEIGHTSLGNTTAKQFLDGVTEFYLLTNSDTIYAASVSGFSRMAANFKNVSFKELH